MAWMIEAQTKDGKVMIPAPVEMVLAEKVELYKLKAALAEVKKSGKDSDVDAYLTAQVALLEEKLK